MIVTFPLAKQRLHDSLKCHYGIEGATLTPLAQGADMDAWVYKVQTPEPQVAYFLKLKRGDAPDISVRLIEMLCQERIQHIIPLINTKTGQTTQIINGHTLMVFPFVAGQNGFSRALNDEQWYLLGKGLRQIHELKLPLAVQEMIPRETFAPTWRQAVQALFPILESIPSGDEIAIHFQTFCQQHIATIHRLVERAEQLAEVAQNQLSPYVLCHSDIHAGNVIINENDTFYIVDWDHPIMAPKERDLMFVGAGVGNVWNQPHEEKMFYSGYGNVDINATLLAYYRHERIVEDLAVYGQKLLLTTEGGEDRLKWYQEFIDQFKPQGVVDVAFKTDENLAGYIN